MSVENVLKPKTLLTGRCIKLLSNLFAPTRIAAVHYKENKVAGPVMTTNTCSQTFTQLSRPTKRSLPDQSILPKHRCHSSQGLLESYLTLSHWLEWSFGEPVLNAFLSSQININFVYISSEWKKNVTVNKSSQNTVTWSKDARQ